MAEFIRRTDPKDQSVLYIPLSNVAGITFRENEYVVYFVLQVGSSTRDIIKEPLDVAHLQAVLGEALRK
ncbi:MAG TPA: hypothetical protein VLK83_06175 [Rhodanobacteraceae bacterium]|nr:hypothetical protein [Rhodanobacteraceae bacterium]